MNSRLDALRSDLAAAHADLLTLIDALAPADLACPTGNGYADVHDTLAHLSSADGGRILLTRACLLIYPLAVPRFVIHLVNRFHVGSKKRHSLSSLKRDLEAGQAQTLRWVARLCDADLDRRLNDPFHGRRTLEEIIRVGHAGHTRGHAGEIRRALTAAR